jgi:hypothetical protein
MISEIARQKQMSTILDLMGEDLDLSPTRYADAEAKYKAVAQWLARPDSAVARFNPDLYPQGSIRLGTAIKPLVGEEFDVDLACEMQIASTSPQEEVKNLVGARLAQDASYKAMLESKNRCWRLNYAKEFHMDIVPAIPDSAKGNGCVLVPDRELREWQPSNPKGYAKWFEGRMREVRTFMEKAAYIENLPVPDPRLRTPLQRAVQLLKRHRDLMFKDNLDDAPISIVITTLAAKAYQGQPDLFTALLGIIDEIPSQLDKVNGHPAVLNPTNGEENFAEKWITNPKRYDTFLLWLKGLRQGLGAAIEQKGMDRLAERLDPLFGKDISRKSMERYGAHMDKEQLEGRLKMERATGLLGATGAVIRKNTWYGE